MAFAVLVPAAIAQEMPRAGNTGDIVQLTLVAERECLEVVSRGYRLRFSVADIREIAKKHAIAKQLIGHLNKLQQTDGCLSLDAIALAAEDSRALGFLLLNGKASVEQMWDKHALSEIRVQNIHAHGPAGGFRFYSQPEGHLVFLFW